MRGAIGRLNGKVLPKLNWSAPKDAHWIHGSLKCTTPSEVFTLLKASDFISHDLCHAFDHCKSARRRPESFSLVLRRWHSLHESNEFRAFVRDSKLVAVSQRHTSTFFEHLTRPDEREAIMSAIQQFCTEEVLGRFSLPRFAFEAWKALANVRSSKSKRMRFTECLCVCALVCVWVCVFVLCLCVCVFLFPRVCVCV